MKLYSTFDKKQGTYGAIMMAPTDGVMCRELDERLSGSSHTVARYPEDFDLYEVGEFDDQTGMVSRDTEIRFVCNLSVVLNGGKKNA